MDWNNSEEWNMNQEYLRYLMLLIIRYGEARMQKDLDNMYTSLNLLELSTSPKVDDDEVERNLKYVWDNLEKCEQRDQDGKMICYFPGFMRKMTGLMDKTYSLLLVKLDQTGILTRKAKDPRKAMGEMGSS